MFVFNYKIKNRGKALRLTITAILILVLIIFALAKGCAGSGSGSATCDEIGEYSLKAETEEQRQNILNTFGIENAALSESDEITIPEEFNSLTEEYNEIQKQTGLDLSPYKGQKAQRLTYLVKGENAVYAVLLINNGKLIGGHLSGRVYGENVRPLTGLHHGKT